VHEQRDFLAFFLKHQSDLRAFIGSLVRDRDARDDLLQEVALVLWEKFSTYDRARSFGAWARGIAAKKIMQRWEKLGRAPLPFAPRTIQAILDAYERTENARTDHQDALERCLGGLPPKSRRLLALRYERSLSLAQIAQRMNRSLDAVHKALSRIRQRLQECIERRLAGEALS
jgi:RNA polymerase sigma-70 factor (ECF subfamily)